MTAPIFPQELAPGIFRCGYNSRSSYGAHSFFARRNTRNILIDSPRYDETLRQKFESWGGIKHILLTHKDDVADADQYATQFKPQVWIHEDDSSAAPFATNILTGIEPRIIDEGLLSIPVPGHTRGSVVYLLDETYLFTGDSLAWDPAAKDLEAFEDSCWYSWDKLKLSLRRLLDYRFEWVLAGHGGSVQLPHKEMRHRLNALLDRM